MCDPAAAAPWALASVSTAATPVLPEPWLYRGPYGGSPRTQVHPHSELLRRARSVPLSMTGLVPFREGCSDGSSLLRPGGGGCRLSECEGDAFCACSVTPRPHDPGHPPEVQSRSPSSFRNAVPSVGLPRGHMALRVGGMPANPGLSSLFKPVFTRPARLPVTPFSFPWKPQARGEGALCCTF